MKDFVENRPQRLCLMCGKCCHKILGEKEYENLQTLAKNGYQNALDFLKIFEPLETFDGKVSLKCIHLNEQKLCSVYENRPDFCREYPVNPWVELPDGCGFSGWIFQQRETIMKNVRRQKEMLIALNAELKIAKDDDKEKIEKIIQKLEASIRTFAKYGADNW